MTNYRQVGGRLGVYIRTKNPTTQQIQGLLADLLAGDTLLPTMREVASSPLFLVLQAYAGSGGGAVQRDALLQELAQRYVPAVLEQVGQLLNGLIDYSQENPSQDLGAGLQQTSNHSANNQELQLEVISRKYDQVLEELTEIKVGSRDAQKYSDTRQTVKNVKSASTATAAIVALVAMFGTAMAVFLSQNSGIKIPSKADTIKEAASEPQYTREPKPPIQNQLGQVGAKPSKNYGCWFQKTTGGELEKINCSVFARRNSNNHLVYDIKELPGGLERTVVLWEGGQVEVLLGGQRYEGSWSKDSDNDIRVSLPSGEFAFTPTAESGDLDRRADEIFWRKYPSLRGQKLQSMDDSLAQEWLHIRKSIE